MAKYILSVILNSSSYGTYNLPYSAKERYKMSNISLYRFGPNTTELTAETINIIMDIIDTIEYNL